MWRDRLEGAEFWPAMWLGHQTHDEVWRRGSICENYADVEIPVYFFGGWADLFRDTPFRIAENLKGPVKVMMGPWAHLFPHEGSPTPKADFVAEVIRFWDHWLKGKDTGLMDEPPLRFWLQDSVPPAGSQSHRPGRWVEEAGWPSPNVTDTVHWLNDGALTAKPRSRHGAVDLFAPDLRGQGATCAPSRSPATCRPIVGSTRAARYNSARRLGRAARYSRPTAVSTDGCRRQDAGVRRGAPCR
jgi:predicted acyl esterase